MKTRRQQQEEEKELKKELEADNDVSAEEKEDEIINDSDSDSDRDDMINENDSDSDEAPEESSLLTSKRIAQENIEKQMQSVLHMKQKQKQKKQERDERNKEQQKKKKSLVPDKLDEKLLQLVDEEIEVTREDIQIPSVAISTQLTEKQQKKKIYFSDDDDDDEGYSDDEGSLEDGQQQKIKAQYLGEVKKETNNNAKDFLRKHFYGDRVKREGFVGHKRTKKNHAVDAPCWLKKRNKR